MISHNGIVTEVEGSRARVRIEQQSACGSCAVRGSCMAADGKVRIVEGQLVDRDVVQGDSVVVEATERVGWLAVLLSFVLPFLGMIFVLWLAGLWLSETVAGTLALCSLLPYYLLVWLFRKRIRRKVSFSIKKQRNNV